MRRFFAENISVGETRLCGQEAAHISRVLRMKQGDCVTLFDGSGTDYAARIVAADAESVLLEVSGGEYSQNEPAVDITLCQAIIKHDHFEYAIQKCTEIGVKRFVPFVSERCVKQPKSPERFLERARRVALEAAKQCGRSLVPAVGDIVDIAELSNYIEGKYTLLAYEGEKQRSIKRELQTAPSEITVIIGPEGGFSAEEAELLTRAGARSVSLGRLILRAETAGMAAAAMTMYECGGQL